MTQPPPLARPPLVDRAMQVLKREHFQLLPDERGAVWRYVEHLERETADLRALVVTLRRSDREVPLGPFGDHRL